MSAPARTPAIVLGIAASAALFAASGSLHPAWWAAWLAPIGVGAVALRSSPRVAFGSALLARLLGGATIYGYFHGALGMPLPITLIVLAAPALVFALTSLLFRALSRRTSATTTALLVAAVTAGADHLRTVSSPHGTFGSVAYSQIDALPIARVASLGGLPLVVFVMTLASTAAAIAIARVGSGHARMLGAAAVVVVLTLAAPVLLAGRPTTDAPTTKVALLAADRPPFPISLTEAVAQDAVDAYVAAIEALADARPDLVVLPETIVAVEDAAYPAFAARMSALARKLGATIVVGIDRRTATVEVNQALVFSPSSGSPASYAKHHLLPPFENRYTPGDAQLIERVGATEQGVAICKDLDFPAWSRSYARRGIGLMIAPAWDFEVDGWLHSRMAVMRAIEGGFALVRSARGGRLTVSDATGRIVAEANSDAARVTTLVASVASTARPTVYTKIGDVFGWACTVALLAAIGLALRPRRVAGFDR